MLSGLRKQQSSSSAIFAYLHSCFFTIKGIHLFAAFGFTLISRLSTFLLHGSFSIRDSTIIPFLENAFEIHSEVSFSIRKGPF